jgi:hypothetical protein
LLERLKLQIGWLSHLVTAVLGRHLSGAGDAAARSVGVVRDLAPERPGFWAKIGNVAETDNLFQSFTVNDSGRRMSYIADVDVTGRGWGWFRIPGSGPIAQDLVLYDDSPPRYRGGPVSS